MENFIAWNPVKLVFGKDVVSLRLQKEMQNYGKNVLLIYGRGSIRQNGIYDTVQAKLKENGCHVTEFGGIKSNPLSVDAQKAVSLAIESKADVILAVGGGSVIDTAKLVALCTPGNDDVWKVMKGSVKPAKALPVIAVLTLAATGTEMNPFAVLQNPETGEKIGFGSPLVYPSVSFLDPSYTFSVSAEYTSYGIADITAHLLEAYFGEGDAPLSDKWVFAILKELIEISEPLLADLQNYEMRERMMWASTQALNGTTLHGRKSGEWGVHDIGHTISYLYDVPHGATLSVAYPAWLRCLMPQVKERLALLGAQVFGVQGETESLNALVEFFRNVKCPVSLSELGLQDKRGEILDLMIRNKVSGMHYKLTEKELTEMADAM